MNLLRIISVFTVLSLSAPSFASQENLDTSGYVSLAQAANQLDGKIKATEQGVQQLAQQVQDMAEYLNGLFGYAHTRYDLHTMTPGQTSHWWSVDGLQEIAKTAYQEVVAAERAQQNHIIETCLAGVAIGLGTYGLLTLANVGESTILKTLPPYQRFNKRVCTLSGICAGIGAAAAYYFT